MKSPSDAAHADIMAHLLTPSRKGPQQTDAAGAASPPPGPRPLSEDPLRRVLAADNPLLEAARPLLRSLAELPALTDIADVEKLRDLLIRDMQQFRQLCERAGLAHVQVVAARYCLCTALDEAVNKMPWARDGAWAADSLLVLFHNEANGGEKFFLLLGRMAQNPEEHLHVLELLYHILSLGFEGRYSLMPDGMRQLETIHRRLLSLLIEQRGPVPPALSPHRDGVSGGRLRILRSVPVWLTALLLGMGLATLFFSLQKELAAPAEQLAARLTALRTPPAPVVPQPEDLPLTAWFSSAEQRRHQVSVVPAENLITLAGGATFTSGTELRRELAPLLDTLAARLKLTGRRVTIVGHTDDISLREGSVFKNNQHLSEERAKTFAAELVRRGVPKEQLHTRGKGDSVPIASNKTPEGRAKNRRVELLFAPPTPRIGE